MRFQLPANVHAISAGHTPYIADAQGRIDVPAEDSLTIRRLTDPHHFNLQPLPEDAEPGLSEDPAPKEAGPEEPAPEAAPEVTADAAKPARKAAKKT